MSFWRPHKNHHKAKRVATTKAVKRKGRRAPIVVKMRTWVGVGLILLSNGILHAAEVTPAAASGPTTRRHLSIEEVNSLLITEAHTEYGTHRQLNEASESSWNTAIDREWSRARELEGETRNNVGALRRATVATGTFPYLVCDTEPGKVGELCRQTIEKHFGTNIVPISNQIDMTCYIVSAIASIAETAPSSLVVSPMLPELKLERGIVDSIVFDHPVPRKFGATLCPGEITSTEERMVLVQAVLARTKEQEDVSGRRLKANFFSHSEVERERSDYNRSTYRTLQDEDDSDLCQSTFDNLHTSIPDKPGSFYFESHVKSTHEDFRKCLLLLVTGLAAQPEVCSIGAVPGMVPLNSEAQWVTQSRRSESRPFFDAGLTGKGQVIGVSDTGLDVDNCYFWDASGNVPKDGSVDHTRRKVVQYVALGDDSDEMKGHGTHVAGTAAGQRATDGVTESPGKVDGIAPGAKIAFVDLGVSGQDTLNIPFPPSRIYEPGLLADSKIHSSSWGIGYNDYKYGERDLDDLMFDNPDLLIVLASGNSGDRLNSVGSPATCKNAIAVGASQNAVSHTRLGMRGEDYLAWFSSAGPTHDGRIKPEVIAPGYYIESAESRPEMVGECDENDDSGVNGMMYSAGTSMAAPVVAGSAALIREYFEKGFYPSGTRVDTDSLNPSSSLVKAVLINGAQPLLGRQLKNLTVSSSSEYDVHQGFGAITLIHSLPLAGKNRLQAKVFDRQTTTNGHEDVYDVTIDGSNECSEPLSATLVWTDPAGYHGCTNCLLNDLDLEITEVRQSKTYYPNGRNGPDTVNNVERIRISDVSNGSVYNVRVKGTNLLSSSQDYSLIITGCLGQTMSNSKFTRERTQDCANQDGTVVVDDEIGMKSCSWLDGNKASYGYLCMFVDVATKCPETCGFCPARGGTSRISQPRTLETHVNGTVEWFGSMFNVAAHKNMTVQSLGFHTDSTEAVEVTVYTKKGTYADSSEQDPEAWTLIAKTTVQGQGFGNITNIPATDMKAVQIKQGVLQAFYVTTGDNKNIILSGGSKVSLELHDAWAKNDDLALLTGEAVTGSFGGSYKPYAWNGCIDYTVALTCQDGSDTIPVENVGEKSCAWLSKNQGRFGYLCERASVATSCPVTCNFCDLMEN